MTVTHVCSLTWSSMSTQVCMWTTCWLWVKDATRQVLQELAKDMEIRWCLVTEKIQEFSGQSSSNTSKGYLFGVGDDFVKQLCTDFGFGELKGASDLAVEKQQEDDTVLDEDGQRQHRQLLGSLLGLDPSHF